MLTLSVLETEVRELKQGLVNKKDKAFNVWVDLITFMFWKHQFGDDWVAIFEGLPNGHPIKELYYGRLAWKEVYFQDVLSCEKGNWFSERFNIALDFCFDFWIEEGFSHRDLANSEVARECFQVIDSVLDDAEGWEDFYKEKREQAELWENKLKYRREFHERIISEEGIQWLQQNDQDFWGEQMKKREVDWQEVLRQKQITAQAVKQVLEEQKETPEQRTDRLLTMAEEKGLIPPPKSRADDIQEWLNQKHTQPQNNSKSPIKVHYIGNLPDASTEIRMSNGKLAPVIKNVIYEVSSQVWHNLQSGNSVYRSGDWVKVDG